METATSSLQKKDLMIKNIKNIKIEKLVYKGFGLGFKDSNPIFVFNSVPGDIVDVKIIHKKGNALFGEICELKERSEFRIEPECKVFGTCGGCDWQCIPYEKQLEYKQIIIEEIFRNIPEEKIRTIVASGKDRYYRNKSFFPISEKNNEPVIGMFERRSHKVVPHLKCFIHPPVFDEVIKVFRNYLTASKIKIYNETNGKGTARYLGIRHSKNTNEMMIIFVTKTRKIPFSNQLVRALTTSFPNIVGIVQNINSNPTNVILGNEDKILFGKNNLIEKIGSSRYKLNYQSFFQVNTTVAEKMYEFVKEHIPANSNVLDAYCGVGSIGIYIAGKAGKVIGIENNGNAVIDARFNAELNNASNCDFITGDVEDKILEICENIDTIIFDPPRKGLNKEIIEKIPDNIKKIIYISCDPSTQVRDVNRLMEKGFKIKLIQPFDMFPQTYHIENGIVLERE